MKTIKSCSLTYTEPPSNKEYHIQLVDDNGGFLVNFQFGRIGNSLQVGTKTPTPTTLEVAEKIYAKLYKEKTGKGYVEGEENNSFEGQILATKKKQVVILPQLLNEIEDPEIYINDDDYLAQEKIDGQRRLVISNEKIIGINKKGTEVSLPNMVMDFIKGLECTIDGEIIDNRISAFDLISKNGEDIRNKTCVERLALLALIPVMKNGDGIVVIDTAYTTEQKRRLFNKLKERNAEGIVFKKKNSPYIAGRPASGGSQLKFKFHKTATFIVSNITKDKRSVGLEVIDGKDKVFMGKVTIPSNHNMPIVGSFVEVRYLYAYKNGAIFQPVYLGERNDSDETDATISQIIYKNENN